MTAQVSIIGNITRDPELRFTAKGDAVANFSVAVNERVKDGDEWVEGDTSFYDVTAWRYLGEGATEALRKGDRVVVVGKMKIEKYETRDGEKRSKTMITADEVGKSVRLRKPKGDSPAAPIDDDIPPF